MQLDKDEIDLFARTNTGIAHCPCSNMRLASGIAGREMLMPASISALALMGQRRMMADIC